MTNLEVIDMTKHVVLNNVDHHELKVISKFDKELGDNVSIATVFPSEFIELQKEYTIVFRINPQTNKYYAAVLLGLNQDNDFLDTSKVTGWDADYVPAIINKGPFLIGFQNQELEGKEVKSLVVHIDLEHPKVNNKEGHSLFLEFGGNSPYLDQVTSILNILNVGNGLVTPMFALFNEFDLITPVTFDIELGEGTNYQLTGNYTINEDKLSTLNGEQLMKLNRSGYLHMAYAVVNSMTNLKKLIERHKSRIQ